MGLSLNAADVGRPIIDMVGKRFGRLVVETMAARQRDGVQWQCRCDCGNVSITDGSKLRRGLTKSCGCLRSRIKDLVGRTYARLTVTALHHVDRDTYWDCTCTCGERRVVTSSNLQRGNTRSCGCLRSEHAGRNVAITRYVKHARDAGRTFALPIPFVEKLMSGNCAYCGAPPANIAKSKLEKYAFRYNGLDRVDNRKGYTRSNVVACCKWCNIAKRERSVAEFAKWVDALHANRRNWPNV